MIDLVNQPCMLCASKGMQFVNKLRDDETHFAVECLNCGHIQIAPLPTIDEDNEYYQKNEMSRRLIPKSQMDDRQMMLKYEIWADDQCKMITNIFPNKDRGILEIGSGYGWFVYKMRQAGYCVDGIELSDEKRQMAAQYLGINLLPYNLLVDSLPKEMTASYNIVCLFEVLEHIVNPLFFIEQAMSLLKPGGQLVIEVPNDDDFLKKHSKEYADFTYFRPHLSYFKSKTLTCLLDKAGLTDLQITGKQVYSLENAIHWLRTGRPFLEKSQIEMPKGLEWIGEEYKRTLERQLISDCLLAIGT
ncbi:MAG: class I SAM-dependent methyltransferase, partial [Prevotellaceae bacterium]|nr:class I SAM-dependent methyltransferase [Prevotellaceae bacterium]